MTNSTITSQARLAQIVSILKKHHISQGIDPVKFRAIIEDLGPTFVKIGQIMASRQDMFSERYCKELVKLRENVAPMDLATIHQVIEDSYGQKLEDVFDDFQNKPLGSASIAQVHKAKLKSGQDIVIKIQRPGIYEMMERDLSLIRKASRILKLNEILGSVVDIDTVLDEFWQTTKDELDFLVEAKHAHTFTQNQYSIQYISSPIIYTEYSTSKVLVMEYIDGYEITQLGLLKSNGYDLHEIAIKLSENYIKQIVDDGFFHADPHPGNIRIRDGKIVWIDFGMMGSLTKEDKDLMKEAVFAIGQNEIDKLVEVILTLGKHDSHIDYTAFYADMESFMTRYIHLDLKDIHLGDAMQEIFTIAHQYHISMPKGISMLARGLVTIESTVMELDPNTNILEIAANHVSTKLKNIEVLKKEVKQTGLKTIDALEHSLDLPIKLSQVLNLIMKGRVKVNLEVMDSSVPLHTIDHMVNKLVVGIVSAGLLMASSILCTTQMTPKLFGIPALGFIGYMSAICLGLWLFYTVLKEKRRRK